MTAGLSAAMALSRSGRKPPLSFQLFGIILTWSIQTSLLDFEPMLSEALSDDQSGLRMKLYCRQSEEGLPIIAISAC